jgi:hypothetical protein
MTLRHSTMNRRFGAVPVTAVRTLAELSTHRSSQNGYAARFAVFALAGAVALNIDLDVVLSVLAGCHCAALRRRPPGYHTATPDTLQRRFLHTSGTIHTHTDHVTVRLARRTYSPVLRQADLPQTTPIPWWGNRTLHFEFD